MKSKDAKRNIKSIMKTLGSLLAECKDQMLETQKAFDSLMTFAIESRIKFPELDNVFVIDGKKYTIKETGTPECNGCAFFHEICVFPGDPCCNANDERGQIIYVEIK